MISRKFNIIIFSIIIISTILLSISTILDLRFASSSLEKQLRLLETSIKNEYKKRLKESINYTIVFIDNYYEMKLNEQKKTLPNINTLTNENQKDFLRLIRKYLYNSIFESGRYTWINKIKNFEGGDNYAIRLIHPNLKETEGSFLTTNAKDIKGNQPYLEELNGIKKDGEIYFTYYFKQLNKDKITEKLSYAKLYKKLNWVIATGIPVNKLNEIIKNEKQILENENNKHLKSAILIKSFVLILFVFLLLVLRKRLSKTLNENEVLNEKLKKRLKNMEANFDKFFELPINLLLISDFKGNIQQINPAWEKILGFTKEDIKGINFFNLVHPNDKSITKIEIDKLSKGTKTLYFENKFRHKDGSYKTLTWSINSIPEEKVFYAVAQDISELKERSHIIYQQSKMAAIGEMISNIAHQWRQPLNIISTSSSGVIVKKENNLLDDDFLINTMNQITKSTQELSFTIENFRNFFTPQKGKSVFTTEQIFKKILNLIEKRFNNYKIKIVKNIENITINNYENEILQVLINLLNNAKDQLNTLEIEEKLIFINVYEKESYIYIEIIDNGNGINKKIIDRIFEPYFTTKNKSIGIGIGLYMSEEIVRKHLKGNLIVENVAFSHEGKKYKGASFTIILKK